MIPVYQRDYTGIKGQGDCVQACVASLLELAYSDVPAFGSDGFWDELVSFLLGHGFIANYHWDCPNLPGYYLAILEYEDSDMTHMVVMKDGTIVHDPNLYPLPGKVHCVISVGK